MKFYIQWPNETREECVSECADKAAFINERWGSAESFAAFEEAGGGLWSADEVDGDKLAAAKKEEAEAAEFAEFQRKLKEREEAEAAEAAAAKAQEEAAAPAQEEAAAPAQEEAAAAKSEAAPAKTKKGHK